MSRTVVAVVLERALGPLARGNQRLEALEPLLRQLGEADPGRRQQLAPLRLRAQQLALAARLRELHLQRLFETLVRSQEVRAEDRLGAVCVGPHVRWNPG